jgi:hypothetical protein
MVESSCVFEPSRLIKAARFLALLALKGDFKAYMVGSRNCDTESFYLWLLSFISEMLEEFDVCLFLLAGTKVLKEFWFVLNFYGSRLE